MYTYSREFMFGLELCGVIQQIAPDAEAVIIGGAVRDAIMGIESHDVDIATNLPIDVIKKHFKTSDIGQSKDFGITLVHYADMTFEVAQYRTDGEYKDGRHPSEIKAASCLMDDVHRRDFTINAMAMNHPPHVIDYTGGCEDMKNRIIRTVGNPTDRFKEDALRILRAARFAARFDYTIEEETFKAMKELMPSIDRVSIERVTQELYKAAITGPSLARYMEILDSIGYLEKMLPEFTALKGLEQNPIHHPEGNCYVHCMLAIKASKSTDPLVNLSIMAHDFGKGITQKFKPDGSPTYHGHDYEGLKLIDNMVARLKISNDDAKVLKFTSENHMLVHNIDKLKRSKVVSLVTDPLWNSLKEVSYADSSCRGPSVFSEEEFVMRIKNAEEEVNKLTNNKGIDGLESRYKEFVDGNLLMDWCPELKTDRKIIGTLLKELRLYIFNKDFNVTQEEVKDIAIKLMKPRC